MELSKSNFEDVPVRSIAGLQALSSHTWSQAPRRAAGAGEPLGPPGDLQFGLATSAPQMAGLYKRLFDVDHCPWTSHALKLPAVLPFLRAQALHEEHVSGARQLTAQQQQSVQEMRRRGVLELPPLLDATGEMFVEWRAAARERTAYYPNRVAFAPWALLDLLPFGEKLSAASAAGGSDATQLTHLIHSTTGMALYQCEREEALALMIVVTSRHRAVGAARASLRRAADMQTWGEREMAELRAVSTLYHELGRLVPGLAGGFYHPLQRYSYHRISYNATSSQSDHIVTADVPIAQRLLLILMAELPPVWDGLGKRFATWLRSEGRHYLWAMQRLERRAIEARPGMQRKPTGELRLPLFTDEALRNHDALSSFCKNHYPGGRSALMAASACAAARTWSLSFPWRAAWTALQPPPFAEVHVAVKQAARALL